MSILVTGATGQQGGATARHLIARGEHVRALVRTIDSPAATALAEAGAELVPGDMADIGSLKSAMTGARGVFSVQSAGPDEVQLGVNVADAADAAGVDHLVYTSVAGVDRANGIGSWETKRQIEHHIRGLDLPTTFLQPVKFMENLTHAQFLDVRTGQLSEPWEPHMPMQVIAVDDIGAIAAIAFADPDAFAGRAFELAGDQLSHVEMTTAITRTTGHTVTYHHLTDQVLAERYPQLVSTYRAAVDFAAKNGGWQADIPALREIHPGLMDFQTWLDRVGAAKFHALFAQG